MYVICIFIILYSRVRLGFLIARLFIIIIIITVARSSRRDCIAYMQYSTVRSVHTLTALLSAVWCWLLLCCLLASRYHECLPTYLPTTNK